MDEKHIDINLGETICSKLRIIFCRDKKGVEAYREIAKRFSELRAKAKSFYADKTESEILKELVRYSPDDLLELLEKDNVKKPARAPRIEYNRRSREIPIPAIPVKLISPTCKVCGYNKPFCKHEVLNECE